MIFVCIEDFIRGPGGKSRYFPPSSSDDLALVIRKPDNREYTVQVMGVRFECIARYSENVIFCNRQKNKLATSKARKYLLLYN